MALFTAALASCISYANAENQHVFVGQREDSVLLLELGEGSFENNVIISEAGEVFLKLDKIVAISKGKIAGSEEQDGIIPASSSSILSASSESFTETRDDSPEVRCSNCGTYYEPKYYKGRKCPVCKTPN